MKAAQIKMIFRSWWRNRLNTVISVIGLTVGLTCSLILILFVMGEYRTASAFKNAEQVYLLQCESTYPGSDHERKSAIGFNSVQHLQETFPEIESAGTLLYDYRITVKNGNGDEVIGLATPSFADVLQLPMIIGDLHKTLSSPDEIAVTRSYALRTFGKENPIGEQIDTEQRGFSSNGILQAEETVKTITSVVDDSRRSMFRFDMLAFQPAIKPNAQGGYAVYGTYTGFVKLYPETDTEELEAKINGRPDTETRFQKFYFVPVSEAYFSNDVQNLMAAQNKSLLHIGLSVALVILLIACFNYINLTMTRAAKRLRNIAGQRIMGATLGNVRWQIITETFLQVILCLLLSLCLIGELLPAFNGFMNSHVSLNELFIPENLLVVIALLILVTLLPSLYILAKMHAGRSLLIFLKKGRGGKSYLTQGMVVAQFAISVILIIVSVNIYRQIHYITRMRPYTKNIVTVGLWSGSKDEKQTFADRVSGMAFAEAVSYQFPLSRMSISQNVESQDKNEQNKSIHYDVIDADENFIGFYGEELIQGNNFSDDPTQNRRKILVNKTFSDQMALADPIGYTMQMNGDTVTVIGMLKDTPRENLRKIIQPAVYRFSEKEQGLTFMAVHIRGISPWEAIDEMKTMWKEIAPQQPMIDLQPLEQMFLNMYTEETRLSKMVVVFTCISILLTVMGLFGLSWYSVEQRNKEIALRKIHGATIGQVVVLLCGGFTKWILIAFIPAFPAAYYFSDLWSRDFAYKAGMNPWVYLATAGTVVLIGLGTVLFQSRIAAGRNPVKAIQTE